MIDVAKDALALMSGALDALGDAHAVWGFSGDGRARVEFAVAKSFDESVSTASWAAIAAIEPRGSSRMGAAIRHAALKLAQRPEARRLLVIVSDGYPQDVDYGPDRLDEEYGVQDTARALRDAERSGIATFCVTIDPAGHDYLGRMCPPRRYRVIEDVPELPEALAAVYADLAE
jgi:nitric oxide reductase activation protein